MFAVFFFLCVVCLLLLVPLMFLLLGFVFRLYRTVCECYVCCFYFWQIKQTNVCVKQRFETDAAHTQKHIGKLMSIDVYWFAVCCPIEINPTMQRLYCGRVCVFVCANFNFLSRRTHVHTHSLTYSLTHTNTSHCRMCGCLDVCMLCCLRICLRLCMRSVFFIH